jgi:23S rRNA pseudouridine2605 synthase
MHPRHEVEKEYHVRIRGKLHRSQLDQLAGGVEIDGRKTARADVRIIKEGEQNDWFSITIHEGRNRQVRRMCEAVSLSVVRLKRVRYGTLTMGTLKPGEFRYLTDIEVCELRTPGTAGKTGAGTPARRSPSPRPINVQSQSSSATASTASGDRKPPQHAPAASARRTQHKSHPPRNGRS